MLNKRSHLPLEIQLVEDIEKVKRTPMPEKVLISFDNYLKDWHRISQSRRRMRVTFKIIPANTGTQSSG